MPKKTHWVDDLLNEVQGGFSLASMSLTAGRMIVAADKMAQKLCDAVEDPDLTPRDISDWSKALNNVAGSLETYAGLYSWCERYSVQGADVGVAQNTLQELLPLLTRDELSQLNVWLSRIGLLAGQEG